MWKRRVKVGVVASLQRGGEAGEGAGGVVGMNNNALGWRHECRRTEGVGVPRGIDGGGVPELRREVGRPLVDVDKLDELGIQVRVAERAAAHEGVVEVLRRGAGFERVELRELCLGWGKFSARRIEGKRTWRAGSQGSVHSGGMPQSSTPGMGAGLRSARMRVSSSSGSARLDDDATAFWLPDVGAWAWSTFRGVSRISSAITALGWLLSCAAGRRMIT